MRKLLRKLHLVPNQPDLADGSSSSSKGPRVALADCPTAPAKASPSRPLLEQKPISGLAGWLSAITFKHGHGPQSPPSVEGCDGGEAERRDSGSTNSRDPELEEEYQIQLALELSAREDPEAVQIEAVKQISLGSYPRQNNPAEVVAYRYWVSRTFFLGKVLIFAYPTGLLWSMECKM